MNPIPSYGIILKHKNKFLIVQRRDSIEYVDALKPRCPIYRLNRYFQQITVDEHQRLLNNMDSFDLLWQDLMLREHFYSDKMYQQSKKKFERHKSKIYEILYKNKPYIKNQKWGFPKGRKNKRGNETEIDCAIREFQEETNFDVLVYNDKIDTPPGLNIKIIYPLDITLKEEFYGSDNRIYSTTYFVFESNAEFKIRKRPCCSPFASRKMTISDEISNMKWVTLEESKKYLNERRYQLLLKVLKT